MKGSSARHVSIIRLHRMTLGLLGWLVFFAFAYTRTDPASGASRLTAAIAAGCTALAVAYLLYAASGHPSASERWLHIGAVLVGAGVPLALLLTDLGRRSTLRRLTLTGGAMAGVVALGYSVAIALLYRVQSTALALAVAVIVLLALTHGLISRAGGSRAERVRRFTLIALGVAGAYGLVNFGTFPAWRSLVAGEGAAAVFNRASPLPPVVVHDQFHYFIGAKYFRELGYDLLYHCVTLAEQDNGRAAQIEEMRVRDLRTNRLRMGSEVLAEPQLCRQRFSPQRWSAFRADVDYFRTRLSADATRLMMVDHGYNASPFWTAMHAPLLARLPAGDAALLKLSMIDLALLAGMFALLCWAFSLETAVLAAVLWGSCQLWMYGPMGGIGSLGRLYWIFGVVAAVCLLRKGWVVLGGAALSLAVLDRVFPGALLFGPGVAASFGLLQRRFDRRMWRTLGGAVAGGVLLTGLGYMAGGGFEDYRAFLRNSSKHTATPLTNYVGLPTLVSTSPTSIRTSIVDGTATEPYAEWKRVRMQTAKERRALYWAVVVLLFAYTAWVCRRLTEPWRLVIAGLLPMFCLFDLTNYYYAVLVVLAPLAVGRLRPLAVLFGMVLVANLTEQHGHELIIYPAHSLLVLCVLLYFLTALARGAGASDGPPDVKTSARW